MAVCENRKGAGEIIIGFTSDSRLLFSPPEHMERERDAILVPVGGNMGIG